MKISHYGVHSDSDGIVHLMQEEESGNFIGLPGVPPFSVEQERACPHLISTQPGPVDKKHWKQFQALLDDPLVRQMLPLPKDRGTPTVFFNDPRPGMMMTLITLSRLCGPVGEIVFSIRDMNLKKVQAEMTITNVAPLVLTDIQTENQEMIERMAKLALLQPRRLILLGDPTIVAAGYIRRMHTGMRGVDEEKLAALPMENLGAIVLKQFARGEKIGR